MRKRFISATAANYFGVDPAVGPAALAAGLHARPELTSFLDDGNEFLLVVQHSGTQLTASNKVGGCQRRVRRHLWIQRVHRGPVCEWGCRAWGLARG